MDMTTHRARITGPISYKAGSGRKQTIPIGPCLVEALGDRCIDITQTLIRGIPNPC